MPGARLRLIEAGVFLLPLLCWPGLDRPFSSPKLWLLVCLGLIAATRAGGWTWLIWPAALAVSSLTGPYVSLEALVLAAAPLPLCWALLQGSVPAERLKSAILWASVVESAIVVLQSARCDPLTWLGWQPELFAASRMRAYGTLGNPNFVAAWLCATLPLYCQAPARPILAVPLALQLAAILATGSRVFVLALPVGIAVLALRQKRFSRWWLAGVPVAAAVLWFSAARPLGVTLQGRVYLARITTSHLAEVPPFGFGPGSFRMQFADWQVDWLRRNAAGNHAKKFAGPLDHAHNDYLEFWVDLGPVGLLAFLGVCAWLMSRAWRRGATGDAGGWSGAAILLSIACVDFPFHRPAEWGLFWLLLGMLGRLAEQKGQSENVCVD